ncbi:MAG: peptide chain release factor 2 [Bullifex sp.]|nr:peptide chain release factor 2 [Spirochaetales bacterium]MDY5776754.1 peptide chain release factor 2 [Bullifex sp.]
MFLHNKAVYDTVKEEAYNVWRRLDSSGITDKIAETEKKTLEPGFWDDKQNAEKVFAELNALKDSYYPWKDLIKEIDDVGELIELYSGEEDPDLEAELCAQIDQIDAAYRPLKLKTLLDGKFDKNDMFLSIHAGAGGTEACDWANMLLRMYLRWCERHGFKSEVLDLLEDEGGIKSATVRVSGAYAFGYLKGEAGVHRLVRISPFDSQKRRHTSFTSVYASPVIDDDIEIELKPEDYRLDTYRAGGAGGQHVNKTDSAVRITHYATGIVVQCQNERSQFMNKDVAFKMLRSRLYEYYQKQREEEHQKNAIAKKDIAWGSQIRSYVFQPYTMVKDHRTGVQVGNINAVMDGDLDQFIETYLNWVKEQEA